MPLNASQNQTELDELRAAFQLVPSREDWPEFGETISNASNPVLSKLADMEIRWVSEAAKVELLRRRYGGGQPQTVGQPKVWLTQNICARY